MFVATEASGLAPLVLPGLQGKQNRIPNQRRHAAPAQKKPNRRTESPGHVPSVPIPTGACNSCRVYPKNLQVAQCYL